MNLLERVIKVANTPTCKNCNTVKGRVCDLCCIKNRYMSGMYWTPKSKNQKKV